jgi:hypothetical protein
MLETASIESFGIRVEVFNIPTTTTYLALTIMNPVGSTKDREYLY